GLVTLATTGPARMESAMQTPEVMTTAWCATDEPVVSDLATLEALWDGKDALAIGPGSARTPHVARVVEGVLERFPGPVILDADALNVLSDAGRVEAIKPAGARVVLTPHPGEMGRLIGVATSVVQAERVSTAWRLSSELGA